MKVWAAQAFDQEYANEYYDNVKELRAQTIGLLPSNLDVFYHKGKLNVLIPIATNFGSGRAHQCLGCDDSKASLAIVATFTARTWFKFLAHHP